MDPPEARSRAGDLRRRGMNTRQQGRRCVECRGTFEPARTAPWQETCSKACRKRRRNRRARQRRRDDLEAARLDERERQRQCRASRRPPLPTCPCVQTESCEGLGTTAADQPVSRTGFRPEPCDILERILEILAEHAHLSRTGLDRELRRLREVAASIPGAAWRGVSPCHGPASAKKALRFSSDTPCRAGSAVTNRDVPRAGVGQERVHGHPPSDVHDVRARGPRRAPRAPPAE